MLTFNKHKEKKINFQIELDGIDSGVLEYFIRLSTDSADYGFKGSEKNGILEFTIPPMIDILKESEIVKLKSIKIEVHDKENKYYLKPFDEIIEFESAPKAITQIKEVEDKKKPISILLKKTDDKNDGIDVPKTKFSKFLN